MNTNKTQEQSQVIIYAVIMALGTFSSRVLGLIRDMAFAALFSRTVTDAWTTAFRLPNMFRRLLGEGSLSVSFIPVFVETRVQEGVDPHRARSHNLVNSFYTLMLILLSVLTVLGIVFAEPIVDLLLDANYSLVPGKFEMTVRMAKIMFAFIFLMSTYAYFMGILNALGKYGLAAMAPTLFNVAMIASTLMPQGEAPGDILAWGVIVGGLMQTGILIPALIKLGYFPRLQLDFRNPDTRRVFKNMVPGLLGMGLLQLTTIVNLRFASQLGEGPISYIYWADRLMELPLSLISVSLGTALLPTLSGMWAKGEQQNMRNTSNYYLRVNLFVAIPASLGLYFLAQPIVEVLFMRGRFTLEDAIATASVVRIYSLTVIASSVVRVLVPSFYAVKNTWAPAAVSGICLFVHILVAPWLMGKFGLEGLMGSSLVSALLNMFLLVGGFYFLIGGLGAGRILKSLMLFAAPAVALVFAIQIYWPVLSALGDQFLAKTLSLSVAIVLGMAAYALVSYLLKIEEFMHTAGIFVEKIRRRISKR